MGRKLDQDEDLVMRDADRSPDRNREARRHPGNDRDRDLAERWDREQLYGRGGMLGDEEPLYRASVREPGVDLGPADVEAREHMDLDTLRGGTDQFFRDEEAMDGADSGGGDRSWARHARRRSEHPRDSRHRR